MGVQPRFMCELARYQSMNNKNTATLILATAISLACVNQGAAQPFISQTSNLEPTQREQHMVTATNSAYYDAFNLPRENNWVLQKIEAGTMQRGCWLDQDTFYPIGTVQVFEGLSMECVEIGKSTRIFWPSRWVGFCQKTGIGYGRCMVERFNP
jgi:hypothetical protein